MRKLLISLYFGAFWALTAMGLTGIAVLSLHWGRHIRLKHAPDLGDFQAEWLGYYASAVVFACGLAWIFGAFDVIFRSEAVNPASKQAKPRPEKPDPVFTNNPRGPDGKPTRPAPPTSGSGVMPPRGGSSGARQ